MRFFSLLILHTLCISNLFSMSLASLHKERGSVMTHYFSDVGNEIIDSEQKKLLIRVERLRINSKKIAYGITFNVMQEKVISIDYTLKEAKNLYKSLDEMIHYLPEMNDFDSGSLRYCHKNGLCVEKELVSEDERLKVVIKIGKQTLHYTHEQFTTISNNLAKAIELLKSLQKVK